MNFRASLARASSCAVMGFGLLMSATSAHSGDLWSASPPSISLADGLQSDGLTAPAFSQTLGAVGGQVTVNKITWWGYYSDSVGAMVADGAPAYADAFVVTFNNGGVGVSGGSLTKSLDAIGGGSLLTRYELSGLSLILLTAPTALDIINNFNDGNGNNLADAQWFWQGTGPSSRAYTIEGMHALPVPEPEMYVQFAVGIAVLGLFRRRKQGAA